MNVLTDYEKRIAISNNNIHSKVLTAGLTDTKLETNTQNRPQLTDKFICNGKCEPFHHLRWWQRTHTLKIKFQSFIGCTSRLSSRGYGSTHAKSTPVSTGSCGTGWVIDWWSSCDDRTIKRLFSPWTPLIVLSEPIMIDCTLGTNASRPLKKEDATTQKRRLERLWFSSMPSLFCNRKTPFFSMCFGHM